MDLFNYDNFTGIHAIEAYWNQGNILACLLLIFFYLLVLYFALLWLAFILLEFHNFISERKKHNNENESNSCHPENRQDR